MTIARSRFDKTEPSSPGKAEISSLAAAQRHNNQNTIRFIDPNLDPESAIDAITLPQQTIYLIDKVVRAKAQQGPIGVDNSEVINLEMEKELRRKVRNMGHADSE